MFSRSSRLLALGLVVLCVLAVFEVQTAEGCTGIMLRNADGTLVHGRTLEFGMVVDTKIAVVPRGYEFVGKAPGGPGMKYKAKYGPWGRSRLMT